MACPAVLVLSITGCGSHTEERSSCAQTVVARWAGHSRSLSSCAGVIGGDQSPVIRLRVGDDFNITSPRTGVVLAQARSTETGVLRLVSASARLARFHAVGRGIAAVNVPTSICQSNPDVQVTECAAVHIEVSH